MTSSYDSAVAIGVTNIAVPTGATLAVFISQGQAVVGRMLSLLRGGTLEILPPTLGFTPWPGGGNYFGTTTNGGTLAAQVGSGWLLQAYGSTLAGKDSLPIPGPAAFYLCSTGATSVVQMITYFNSYLGSQ